MSRPSRAIYLSLAYFAQACIHASKWNKTMTAAVIALPRSRSSSNLRAALAHSSRANGSNPDMVEGTNERSPQPIPLFCRSQEPGVRTTGSYQPSAFSVVMAFNSKLRTYALALFGVPKPSFLPGAACVRFSLLRRGKRTQRKRKVPLCRRQNTMTA